MQQCAFTLILSYKMRVGISFFIIALVMPLMSFITEYKQTATSDGPRVRHINEQPSCSVTGLRASSVTKDRAKLSYSVKGAEVTGFGVCWSQSGSPSLETGTILKSYEDEARDIPSEVSFMESVTDLEAGTKYTARAYVTDSGGHVYYSEEVSFTTEKKDDFSSMLNGPKTDYHPNGKIARKYTVKDGVPYGSVKSYSDSGNIMIDQNFVDGIPNGSCVTYYSNGKVQSESNYVDGLPQGLRKEYYMNGNIKSEIDCTGEMDNLTCSSKVYYENGGLRSESKMSNGELLSSVTYDDQGRIMSEQKPGSIVSYSYDRDGYKHMSVNGAKCQCARCNL
jgi:antitoxin component YwqK of YwqJK toxin-antitoxin module